MDPLALPFDQYQRYRLIQQVIDTIRWQERLKILDVGGSPDTLASFLPNDCVVISGLQDQGKLDVYCSGLSLPFADGTFDVVATADTLEHLPAANRTRFLSELARVSREAVLIAAPFDDPAVNQAEELFQRLIWSRYGEGYHFIEEHRAFGLPSLYETSAILKQSQPNIEVLPNGYLHRWLLGISTFFLLQWRFHDEALNARANAFYNSNFYPRDNCEPSYRKLIVGTRSLDVSGLRSKLTSTEPQMANQQDHLQVLSMLVQTFTEKWSERAVSLDEQLAVINQLLLDREQQLSEKTARVQQLSARLDGEKLRVAQLSKELDAIHNSLGWAFVRKIHKIIFKFAPYGSQRWKVFMKLIGKPGFYTGPVSIIIPVFNQVEHTRQCVEALKRNTAGIDYELIFVDNASSHETQEFLRLLDGVKVIRNESNRGFSEACNQGAAIAGGKYIVFLNNDTEPQPGWLQHLVQTAEEDPAVAAVGAKLIYPDGKLQEAGGIIFQDGSAWNFGRGDDPAKPEYNYLREVSYCSAACLLVRRESFRQVGGFDARFSPAYFEDADLAFAFRKIGYKVLYQPAAEVVHLEGGTAGTDLQSGYKQYQVLHQNKFQQKWAQELLQQPVLGQQSLIDASNFSAKKTLPRSAS